MLVWIAAESAHFELAAGLQGAHYSTALISRSTDHGDHAFIIGCHQWSLTELSIAAHHDFLLEPRALDLHRLVASTFQIRMVRSRLPEARRVRAHFRPRAV